MSTLQMPPNKQTSLQADDLANDWNNHWISSAEFLIYLRTAWRDESPLKGSKLLEKIKSVEPNQNIASEQVLSLLSSDFSLQAIDINAYHARDLGLIIPILFAVKGDQFLPLEKFPKTINPIEVPEGIKLFYVTNQLPNQKLTKVQFINRLLDSRYKTIGMILVLGLVPILISACAELLNQPLFDTIVPSGQIPAVILIGVATLFFQGSGQIITSLTQQFQVIFDSQVGLASKLATGQRFLDARTQDLPQRDVGNWRLTFSVASAFLGSFQSLFISIPLAIFSLVINLLVMGAFTDFTAVVHLFLICLIPTFASLLITYASSTIALKMMGQQSKLESIIYSVVKNIRGIWMSNSQAYFQRQFETARSEMAKSLLKSGTVSASTDVIDKITTGLMYSYIYFQYYRSSTVPGEHPASVGSLLVIYSAIGIVSGSLNSISGDLVSIFQTLPTYWTPNAIRDISSFVAPIDEENDVTVSSIEFNEITYQANGIKGPFKNPISFRVQSPGSVAIVGPSGSGKSTLLRLILGHLKPSSGQVLLLDQFGNDIAIDLYQANVLVLTQDVRLFGDHLRDVVDPAGKFTDQELEKAASQLNLTEVLDQLPLRWLTPINEFSRDLSLGQLQLFKLTKALLKRYSIIISDEPTCHLPENLHMQSLKLLNDNCDLHLSVLHRQTGLSVFESVLSLTNEGEVTMQGRSLS